MIYCLEVLFISLLAAHGTHFLISRKSMHPVRASSLLTLIFVALTYFISHPTIPLLQAAFFGGSFVGMSDSKRLTLRQLTAAGIVFAVVYCFLIHYLKGIGGALGLSAFASCLLVYSSGKVIKPKN